MRLTRRANKPARSRTATAARRARNRWRVSAALGSALRRIGLRGAVMAAVAVIVIAGWQSGVAARFVDGALQGFYSATARAGLVVNEVLVEGRSRSDAAAILAQLDIERGSPILRFDPAAAREALERLPWVAAAVVDRRLPDTIYLRLVERQPVALWQYDGEVVVIDRQGAAIEGARPASFADLPLLVGEGAAGQAGELLDMLAGEPDLAARVIAAVRVGARRWNLQLEGPVDVHLPEVNPAAAWSRFAELEREHGLLERDVVLVDLRMPDRLVVRTSSGELPERLRSGKASSTET